MAKVAWAHTPAGREYFKTAPVWAHTAEGIAYYARTRGSIADRFNARVDRSGGAEACWLWMARRDRKKGYGEFGIGERGAWKKQWAHRVAWELANGPIPGGLLICHRCDNPPCCNPAHLFLGTVGDNTADMDSKGRRRSACGVANAKAKLSEADVLAIRRMCDARELPQSKIGPLFGVDKSTVSDIGARRTWRHLAE